MSRGTLTAKLVRTKTSLIFWKILERCHGGQGGRARTVLSKSPPPGGTTRAGHGYFMLSLLLWGADAPDQEHLRRWGVERVCLVALFQLCDVRHTFCKLIHTDPCLT